MPVAVGAAVLTTVGATTLAASTTAAYVVGTVIITGALVGASYALQTMTAQKPKRERQQATLNESMGPRRFIYGQQLVGGTRAFWDARYGEMHQCIMLCSHEVDSITEYWVGDRRVNTDLGDAGGNVIDYPMINKVFFEPYLGTSGQAAPTILRARFPEVWSTDHRLRGIAHVCVVFGGVKKDDQSKVFPQGAYTQLRFTVKGKKIYDPSIGGMDPEDPGDWAWGDNSADVILDYLRSADGYRRSLAQIDMDSFEDFHAHCAENVPRADSSPVGRYRTWGTISFDEEPQAALARLCSTCDGLLYQGPTGLIGIRHGGWTGPLINIPTRHITGAALTQGNDKLETYNRLKVSYTDPENYYQPTELVAVDNTDSQAAIGVIEEVRDLSMVPEWTQAARLAKIMMFEDNPAWKGTISTDLMPLDALGESAVDITYDPVPDGEEPLMNAPCKIGGFMLRGDLSGCDLTFRSVPASAREWNAATEEPPRPARPVTITADYTVEPPASLTTGYATRNLSEYSFDVDDTVYDPIEEENSTTTTTVSGAVTGYVLTASWPAPPRDDLSFELEYESGGIWKSIAVSDGETAAESAPVARLTTYSMRIRHVSGAGNTSAWTDGADVSVPA